MNGIVSLQEFPVDPNAVPVPRVTPSAADLDQITNALGGGANSMLMLNLGIDRGNDIASQNQIIAVIHLKLQPQASGWHTGRRCVQILSTAARALAPAQGHPCCGRESLQPTARHRSVAPRG